MRSSIVIQLSTLSVGVLGGVVPGPYYVNSTTTIGTPRPHVHAPGLPTPPTTLSASISDLSTAIVAPYPTSSSNTSVVDASPSSSTAYAVSSSSPEVSTVTLWDDLYDHYDDRYLYSNPPSSFSVKHQPKYIGDDNNDRGCAHHCIPIRVDSFTDFDVNKRLGCAVIICSRVEVNLAIRIAIHHPLDSHSHGSNTIISI
ncbi:unnamed protein product [Alternaria alternata]